MKVVAKSLLASTNKFDKSLSPENSSSWISCWDLPDSSDDEYYSSEEESDDEEESEEEYTDSSDEEYTDSSEEEDLIDSEDEELHQKFQQYRPRI